MRKLKNGLYVFEEYMSPDIDEIIKNTIKTIGIKVEYEIDNNIYGYIIIYDDREKCYHRIYHNKVTLLAMLRMLSLGYEMGYVNGYSEGR